MKNHRYEVRIVRLIYPISRSAIAGYDLSNCRDGSEAFTAWATYVTGSQATGTVVAFMDKKTGVSVFRFQITYYITYYIISFLPSLEEWKYFRFWFYSGYADLKVVQNWFSDKQLPRYLSLIRKLRWPDSGYTKELQLDAWNI